MSFILTVDKTTHCGWRFRVCALIWAPGGHCAYNESSNHRVNIQLPNKIEREVNTDSGLFTEALLMSFLISLINYEYKCHL